jgi:hypothetical protein
MRRLKIYFAGKIKKNRDHDYLELHEDEIEDAVDGWGRTVTRDMGPYKQTGALIAQGDDHGCTHGAATHGANSNTCAEYTNCMTRPNILRLCCKQINFSHVLIATINKEHNCFGTLNEIAYAFAMRKVVIIVFEESEETDDIQELWFSVQMSVDSIRRSTLGFRLSALFDQVQKLKSAYGSLYAYTTRMNAILARSHSEVE